MLKNNHKFIRGDTLIEVLFATAAFSLIAVSGLSIMNQGTSTAQRALEITLVRQEIDAQAETLRFLNSSYISAYQSGITSYSPDTPAGQWKLIQDSTVANASSFDSGAACQKPQSGSFIVNTHNAKVITAAAKLTLPVTFSQVQYDYDAGTKVYTLSRAEGIWVEAVRFVPSDINQVNAGYIDFHIRACWDSPGQVIPVTIGTIVRLYEPRG